MRKTIVFSVLIICLSMVLFAFKNERELNYFEGVIIYEKSFKSLHPKADLEFLDNHYGTKQILYYKEGNMKRINLSSKGDTLNMLVFNAKNKRVYGSFDVRSDTLMTYSATSNDFESYHLEDFGKKELNGEELSGFKLNLYYRDQNQRVLDSFGGVYYYSNKYALNPKYHAYIKDGFNDEITKQYPFLVLMSIENNYSIKIETKKMIDIKEIELSDETFNIHENKILVEM